jgi:hypothetical protein
VLARDELTKALGRISSSLASSADYVDELDALDRLQQREKVDVTIGIATFDDFDGAFFTITALHLYHPGVMKRAEILLIDNNPDGREAASLRDLQRTVPRLRYVPVRSVRSTAVRDLAFRLASGDVVVVLDSHVLLSPGSLKAVEDYLAEPDCRDLVQGPLLTYAADALIGTHWDPIWRAGMYGAWALDERGRGPDGEPFDIPMQGLGVFACRRDAWPGLNPRLSGFGGEEGYLHAKFRLAGGRTVCLPAFRWMHRFDRPRGVSYDLVWEQRVRNYLIGWREVGADLGEIREHFTEYLGAGIGEYIDQLGEKMSHPLWQYDGVLVINDDLRPGLWTRTLDAFAAASLEPRRLRPATDMSSESSVAAATRYAKHWGWSTFAVITDDVVGHAADLDVLAERLDASIDEPLPTSPGPLVRRVESQGSRVDSYRAQERKGAG